jgi:hypothetical protein
MTYKELLHRFPRIAIVGGPRVGKTTLSRSWPIRRIVSSDDIKHLAWGEQPDAMLALLDEHGLDRPFVVEGVQVVRVLRRGLEVDAVIYLDRPHVPRSVGQNSMAKGILTVLSEWRATHPEVPIFSPSDPTAAALEFYRVARTLPVRVAPTRPPRIDVGSRPSRG